MTMHERIAEKIGRKLPNSTAVDEHCPWQIDIDLDLSASSALQFGDDLPEDGFEIQLLSSGHGNATPEAAARQI
jgi:hypothetical protein